MKSSLYAVRVSDEIKYRGTKENGGVLWTSGKELAGTKGVRKRDLALS